MCIVLLTTLHPDYPLILLSNRDEFLSRPTARAAWWDGDTSHVLGGRDMERAEHGTWLGITKQGRIAALTNFREPDSEKARDKSRGGIINAFLTRAPHGKAESDREFTRRLIEDVGVNDVGGFSLLFGTLAAADGEGKFPGLSILSNRSQSVDSLVHIASAPGETHGLSNSHFGDVSWPKVVHGEQFLKQAAHADAAMGREKQDEEQFLESLFDILSVNTLPARKEGEEWDTYVVQMRNSIFIPPVSGPSMEGKPAEAKSAETNGVTDHAEVRVAAGAYGTQKQSVILVGKDGRVVFVERTLYGEDGRRLDKEEAERRFEFEIEGWKG